MRTVRWNKDGSLLVSAGAEGKVKIIDFKSEKTLFVGSTSDGSKLYSVEFE